MCAHRVAETFGDRTSLSGSPFAPCVTHCCPEETVPVAVPAITAERKTFSSVPGAPPAICLVLKGGVENAAPSGVLNSAVL